MKNEIYALINECRLRIDQLEKYKKEEFLIGVIHVFNWMLEIKQFQSGFNYLEKEKRRQELVLAEIGNKFFEEIKKTWEIIKKNINLESLLKLPQIKHDLLLIKKENKYIPKLQQMIEGKEEYYILDIYNQLRYLIEHLCHFQKEFVLKNKLVILNEKNIIKEFAPDLVFKKYVDFINIEEKIKEINKNTPVEALNYLNQLLILYKEDDWKWQLEQWVKVFDKDFYIPRLQILTNFLYDYLLLKIKSKQDFDSEIKKYNINTKFSFEEKADKCKMIVGEDGEYGFVNFFPRRTDYKDGKRPFTIMKLITKTKDKEVFLKDLINKVEGLTKDDIYTYRNYLNQRFETSWQKNELKIRLSLLIEQGKLKLYVYPSSKKFLSQSSRERSLGILKK